MYGPDPIGFIFNSAKEAPKDGILYQRCFGIIPTVNIDKKGEKGSSNVN